MAYKLSKRSLNRLETCHPDLQTLVRHSIAISSVDFFVVGGHRSLEEQKRLYDEGKSKIDGISKLGNHNYDPSRAVDICAYINGRANWGQNYGCYLGGLVMGMAAHLLAMGQMSHLVRWGGNWKMDGRVIEGQTFIDLPHFELIGVKD